MSREATSIDAGNTRNAGLHQTVSKRLLRAPAGSGLEYVCVIAVVDPTTGLERTLEGRCAGAMALSPAGGGGFGYDPVFVPAGRDDGLTMAELDDTEKDAISHRGIAARRLLDAL
ncbi:MAG: non-canonical purine NTP pyrophosphatase [Betaproteobacteria bacterium]|nr:non-canonical purine NTP pyrophosphatase [Betaproteobacteria bacterium]